MSTQAAATQGPTQSLIAARNVADASLHIRTPKEWHIYGFPFAPLYAVWFYFHFIDDNLFGSPEVGRLAFISVGAAHALTFLVCQWSVKANVKLTCKKAEDPYKAEVVKVIPTAHNGAGALCNIIRTKDAKTKQTRLHFFFQQKKFIYNDETKLFEKLDYPTNHGYTIQDYINWRGLVSDAEVDFCREKYGPNKFDIPIPKFGELFKEHLMAPFFVFQLFCVALWFLDDMWYYSLFTLAMLFLFESTVVFQRLRNLQEFRSMSIKPYPINAYRNKKWSIIQTDDLLPGDIVSIVRQKDDSPVPGDMVVLDGSCIANEAMLSGESTPQLKEAVSGRDGGEVFSYVEDRNNMLFGGTKVLQVTPPAREQSLVPPDNGAVAYVVRTGFATQQGKLVQTIIYSTERITANNLESLLFILFLLVFAIAASAYVWIEGTKNEERNRSKVLLDCILIITAVVPPELPMELSLAVNNSLIGLAKSYIYCTEPFRIPFAGKVDVACFDKTGTLTAENLIVEGITGLDGGLDALLKPTNAPERTTQVLAAAHALVMLDDGIIGDPMEKNTLESIDWTLTKSDVLHPKKDGQAKDAMRIIRRFQFSSSLKRMSTVSARQEQGRERIFVAVKGAPETIKNMLVTVPEGYDEHYKTWARRGKRVLALGYKVLPEEYDVARARDLHRDEAESKLVFAGFLVFGCPLKSDAVKAVRMLNRSSHRTVMITGDNALTACHVAQEVDIVSRQVLIADVWEDEKLAWKSVDETIAIEPKLEQKAFDMRLDEYDLCCTGKGLSAIMGTPAFAALLPRIWVYARVSPGQKESILTELKLAGYTTLMCGDGTNDVGALKQAHVGIALLDGDVEKIEKLNARMREKKQKAILEQQAKLRERWGLPPLEGQPAPHKKVADAADAKKAEKVEDKGKPEENKAAKSPRKKQPGLQESLSAAMEAMDDVEGDVPKIKFGDASVAAPFTSKISSVMSVVNIVRQGRATLVAMVQMYKILALNCLISAFSMSVLYLSGIKQGDWQATIAGMMITVCFFGIAKSTALEELSRQRPQSNVFNHYVIISVLGQAACHVASLMYIQQQAHEYAEDLEEDIKLDAEFQPNLLNSGVYLVSLIMQISTFAINYQGLPFRESIFNNKALYNSLVAVGGIAVLAASEFSDALNEWMQLVPFPDEFRYKLIATMALDFGGAWAVEQVCTYLFSDARPKASLFPRGH
ncbi:hypothetical protein PhCBS80983_g04821 [Powellomyces hirtus]|uniref:Cation-transporting P-type ATPase N-terminal domain-containing protein n=1 Tax=Powellomyces hirtus TaxID=109895 RepID=A0A507DYK6_9FUNG|nr:hypothetical protein PhCBS80983_g04821 [Powellomyces hirtus]